MKWFEVWMRSQPTGKTVIARQISAPVWVRGLRAFLHWSLDVMPTWRVPLIGRIPVPARYTTPWPSMTLAEWSGDTLHDLWWMATMRLTTALERRAVAVYEIEMPLVQFVAANRAAPRWLRDAAEED